MSACSEQAWTTDASCVSTARHYCPCGRRPPIHSPAISRRAVFLHCLLRMCVSLSPVHLVRLNELIIDSEQQKCRPVATGSPPNDGDCKCATSYAYTAHTNMLLVTPTLDSCPATIPPHTVSIVSLYSYNVHCCSSTFPVPSSPCFSLSRFFFQ